MRVQAILLTQVIERKSFFGNVTLFNLPGNIVENVGLLGWVIFHIDQLIFTEKVTRLCDVIVLLAEGGYLRFVVFLGALFHLKALIAVLLEHKAVVVEFFSEVFQR